MKHVVIIGTVIPEPNSTAAGKRMLQLIDFFQSENYKVTFLSAASISEFSFDLNSIGVNFHNILLNDSSFEILIKDLNPNVVIFDRFTTEEQFGWKVSETCPEAARILDTEDLHFLRKARENSFKQNKIAEDKDLISDVFKRETASILRCDLSLIISEFEMKLLTEKFKIDETILHYLPLFAEIKPAERSFSERKNFVSIGNFLHEPNWQTVLKLKKIWPEIRKRLPEAEMHIYGAYVTEKARQLHNGKDKFLIKGRAESVEKIFENGRLLLAPIPFGAGIKGKLLDSMVNGLPSVTSTIGAEGMKGSMDWNGHITDDDSDFVKKAVDLYNNENEWKKAQQNGYKIIESKFKKENFLPSFSEKIKDLLENTDEHRQRNFLGQILQHHTLQSTKYLGKWIEEKNRN